MGGGAEFGVPVAGPVPCGHLSFTWLPYVPAMSESSTGGSYGKAGFTRRRFIIGTAGVSAVAALGGTVVRAPRAVASGAPSGQPAPTLAVSAQPITAHNPGRLVKMPDPKPLDVTQRYGEAASVSFTDGLNG